MKKTKKKKLVKCLFIEDCGIFQNQILVGVGVSYKEIIDFSKKEKANDWFTKGLEERKDIIESLIKEGKTGFVMEGNDLRGAFLLWLEKYDWKDWHTIEVLLHELHHLVYFTARQKSFEMELEAQAFLFEDLFHRMRRKLAEKLKF